MATPIVPHSAGITNAAPVLQFDGITSRCATFTPEDNGPQVLCIGALATAEQLSNAAQRHGLTFIELRTFLHFMEGKALYADLLRQALALQGSGKDPTNLLAYYRGPGVMQNAFALPVLQKLAQRPELAAGFAAVFSESLIYSAPVGLTPEAIEATTYAECTGPVPSYIAEEGE